MNKRQIETEKAKLAAEAKEVKHLKAIYQKASDDIAKKIKLSNGKINVLLKDFDNLDEQQKSILQSQIYQRGFQQSLKTQIDGFMSSLLAGQYKSVDNYLRECYTTGFVGALYDITGQGIPIISPIDEKKVVKAMYTDSKLSKKLYTKLGEDVDFLKKRIANNLSRGIATADSYSNIARNIANDSNAGFNRAMRIARTEGHRVQCQSAFDAQLSAKDAGADIVKMWNAALDGKTRPHHRQLDGQIRELEEPFEVAGMKVMYPSDFGRAAEDINCRCALMQRAKWALDEDELEVLKKRAEYFGLDKTKDFNDYKKKYLKQIYSANAPIIKNPIVNAASNDVDLILKNSKGVKNHVIRLRAVKSITEFKEDSSLVVPFSFDKKTGMVYFNTKVEHFEYYDLNFAIVHELTHKLDAWEYNVLDNEEFKKTIATCQTYVMEHKVEIQQWFVEGGKYQYDFAMNDIISALSNNEIETNIGHSNWGDKDSVEKEIFANLSTIDVLGKESKEETFIKYLLDVYKEIVK